MSTLRRAERKWQKHGGAEKSESSCFCPTHFSAFQKRVNGCRRISDNPKNFGNISEKQPFSEKISDLFFVKGIGLGQGRSKRACRAVALKAFGAKAGQTQSKWVKAILHFLLQPSAFSL
jgi:hypothetical protein